MLDSEWCSGVSTVLFLRVVDQPSASFSITQMNENHLQNQSFKRNIGFYCFLFHFKGSGETRGLTTYHLSDWPAERETPKTPQTILSVIREVQQTMTSTSRVLITCKWVIFWCQSSPGYLIKLCVFAKQYV